MDEKSAKAWAKLFEKVLKKELANKNELANTLIKAIEKDFQPLSSVLEYKNEDIKKILKQSLDKSLLRQLLKKVESKSNKSFIFFDFFIYEEGVFIALSQENTFEKSEFYGINMQAFLQLDLDELSKQRAIKSQALYTKARLNDLKTKLNPSS